MSLDFFADRELVRSPPVKRAAYADRTAWILAEIARLVYRPLPEERSVRSLVEEVVAAVRDDADLDTVQALVTRARRAGTPVANETAAILRTAGFELVRGFAAGGTEAFVAKLAPSGSFEGMLVLVFRGTEPGKLEDLLTDARADLVPAPGGGRVHRGFLAAFRRVERPIRETLAAHAGPPLYLAGHSLGGALALIATRYLESDGTGATYTYGCPRAADDAFFGSVKTPVYRVVNAADGVARLPFGYSLTVFLALLRLVPVNGSFRVAEWLRRKFAGYTHHGSLVFLSAPPHVVDAAGIAFPGLKVRFSPDVFWRMALVVRRWIGSLGTAAVTDHAIEAYSAKLLAHAQRRNRAAPARAAPASGLRVASSEPGQ